jgi:hypothetical protein
MPVTTKTQKWRDWECGSMPSMVEADRSARPVRRTATAEIGVYNKA